MGSCDDKLYTCITVWDFVRMTVCEVCDVVEDASMMMKRYYECAYTVGTNVHDCMGIGTLGIG